VLGLREPDSGTHRRSAASTPGGIRGGRRQKIGAALQTTALQDKITPREALHLFGSFYRNRDLPRPAHRDGSALTEKADAPVRHAVGRAAAAARARARLRQPSRDLVLLDEPTERPRSPIPPRVCTPAIHGMKRDGHTVLLTTHQLDEAEALCDRIAVIDRGRIAATGATREITALSSAPPTVSVVTDRPLRPEALAALPGVSDLDATGTVARFRSADVNRTLAALLAIVASDGAQITELHVQRASLEDVFLELTGGAVH
jgi:ABC-2 type transport system ATP-binding protein